MTYTAEFLTPTESELVAMGFPKYELSFTSPVSGVIYKFPYFEQGEVRAMPFLRQNPDGSVTDLYYLMSPADTETRDKIIGRMSTAPNTHILFPSDNFISKFPHMAIMKQSGIQIIGPLVCLQSFAKLEQGLTKPTDGNALRSALEIKSAEGILITSRQCVDSLTKFMSVPQSSTAQPQIVGARTAPSLFGSQQTQTPIQDPFSSAVVYQPPSMTFKLDDAIARRLDEFINIDKCGSKSSGSTRLTSLLSKVNQMTSDQDSKKTKDKYLNLSTCQFGKGASTNMVSYGGSVIPDSNPRRNLNMRITHPDLTRLITGSDDQGRLDVDANRQIIEAIFKRVEKTIFDSIGTTTRKVEEAGPTRVPLSILDSIPAGPKPSGRPEIVFKTAFQETIPLAGVTILGQLPISDGKRCIPKLSSKKKGIMHISQENLSKQKNMFEMLRLIANTSPVTVPYIAPRPDVLKTLVSNISEVQSAKNTGSLATTTILGVTQAEKPITFDVSTLSRNLPDDQVVEAEYLVGEDGDQGDDDYVTTAE